MENNFKGRPCKWLTGELKKEINNRDRQLRKVRKSNSENDRSSYKRLQNRCNTLIRKAKTSYHQNLLTENETNPRQFWNVIKEIYLTKPRPVGSVTTNKKNSKSTVSRFSYFFKTAIKEIKEVTFPLINFARKSRNDKCVHTNKDFIIKYVLKIFIEKELLNSWSSNGLCNVYSDSTMLHH